MFPEFLSGTSRTTIMMLGSVVRQLTAVNCWRATLPCLWFLSWSCWCCPCFGYRHLMDGSDNVTKYSAKGTGGSANRWQWLLPCHMLCTSKINTCTHETKMPQLKRSALDFYLEWPKAIYAKPEKGESWHWWHWCSEWGRAEPLAHEGWVTWRIT